MFVRKADKRINKLRADLAKENESRSTIMLANS